MKTRRVCIFGKVTGKYTVKDYMTTGDLTRNYCSENNVKYFFFSSSHFNMSITVHLHGKPKMIFFPFSVFLFCKTTYAL